MKISNWFYSTVTKTDRYGENPTEVTQLSVPKTVSSFIAGIFAFSILWGSFYIVGGTEYAVERTPSGEMQGVVDPGVHWKVPLLSSVHKYDQFFTVAYQDDNDENPDTHGSMKRINFADTYGGHIGATIRYQILPDPLNLVAMHKAYLNDDNLIESGLKPVSKQLLAYTANQITGENYMQGGQNEYQNRIEDQGNFGLYVTKREKVMVQKNSSSVGLDNQNPDKRDQRDSFVYINKIQKDANGTILRNPLPISKYGIKVVQVTVDDFTPEDKLKDFINRKKDQIAIRQKLIEDQENERQSAVTAELKGQRKRVEARQEMLMEKDAAVIVAQKRVELEQKDSDMQVVRKNKELEIATANEGIQKANAIAAKYQASAITFKGLAEAKVKKAMYDAVDPQILAMEVDRVTQLAKYEAVKVAKVEMPKEVTIMSGSGNGESLGNLTNYAILGMKDSLAKTAGK